MKQRVLFATNGCREAWRNWTVTWKCAWGRWAGLLCSCLSETGSVFSRGRLHPLLFRRSLCIVGGKKERKKNRFSNPHVSVCSTFWTWRLCDRASF